MTLIQAVERPTYHPCDSQRNSASVAVLDIVPFKQKSVSVHWEFMFTRSMFGTADIAEQGRLLNEVSRLVDAGTIRKARIETLGPIDAAGLKRAHALVEGGRAKGKVVLEEFGAG